LTPAELRETIHRYYRAREWDEDGFIPEKKLTELGIPTFTSALLKRRDPPMM
jgi:aldehyde:ferredoxin oxidoreductase